jgi:lipopolysaccharide/colanic/teichoic acid biosynthesis glycosyltransferase
MKRLFDITFSLAGLIILSPLFAIFYLLVKISGPGPALFVQKRIGMGFRPFYLYRFRTMLTGVSRVGRPVTTRGDIRVTRIGRFLRRTKLDELPQLFNVLKGDMSLVGPRPELRRHVSKYRKDYREILKVRPGITDVASFTYMDEEGILKDKKDPEEYYINVLLPERIKHAKAYVRKAFIVHDIKLIIFTMFTIIYPKYTIIRLIDRLGFYRRPIVVGIQVLIFIFSNYLAFMIRFDGSVPESAFALFLKFITILVLLRVLFLFIYSLDKGLWRYSSSKDLSNIVISTTLSSLLFILCVRYLFQDINYP